LWGYLDLGIVLDFGFLDFGLKRGASGRGSSIQNPE
jgi:hypothetical protein